ncbi:MAG: trigger factor [Nitrospinota bacterium]|jgi:trigger factor|nr:trigger factor [Nitrospinota bacterium]MDH5789379.1 trigger factor [Nitrospinota bacterium]
MKCEVEEIDACNRKLTIEIPLGDYKSQLNAYYQKLGREVKVPGFRPGKVPTSMLEKRFGPEVKQEVLTQMVSDSIAQGIQDNKLRAMGDPSVVEINAEEGTDITVTANVEVLPTIEINDYKDLEVKLRIPKITDEDVDKMVDAYRQQKSKTVQVSDRASQKDDLIKIDFDCSVDGQPIKEGSAKDYIIQIGAKNLVEGFDEEVTGMQLDEERTFQLSMPGDHPNAEIAGKEVEFKVTLKGIQIKELPELNDEFAQTADPKKVYNNLEEMRQGIRDDLLAFERTQAKKASRKEMEEKLGEANPINIPEKLVKEQIAFMVNKEKQAPTGNPVDTGAEGALTAETITPEDEKKHREGAIKILQQELVIGQLSDDFNTEVSDQDLNREMTSFAQMMGSDVKKLKKEWSESGALLRLHSRMRREKTLDQLIDKVKVTEEMVDRSELEVNN